MLFGSKIAHANVSVPAATHKCTYGELNEALKIFVAAGCTHNHDAAGAGGHGHNEVHMGQVWNANVTSLASGNFSNTRYGNGSVNPNLGTLNPQTLYEEAAWLVTQFASHSGDYVSLQYALWDLMTPGAEPTNFANADGTTVAQWLALAAANRGQINPGNFVIIANTGTLAYRGQVQEFIVQTPEPATAVLLLIGVVSIFLLTRRSQQQPA